MFFISITASNSFFCLTDKSLISTLSDKSTPELEIAVKSKDEALNFMTDNFEKQSKLNNELSGKLADAEKENTVIRDKLAKSNLIADSIANPKVMEQKINEQVSTIFGALSDSTK